MVKRTSFYRLVVGACLICCAAHLQAQLPPFVGQTNQQTKARELRKSQSNQPVSDQRKPGTQESTGQKNQPDCDKDTYCRVFLPLNRGNVTMAAIHSFYNSGTSGVSFLEQVQYLYGLGGATHSLSADMIGGSTGFGMHFALGSMVTAGGKSTATPDAQNPERAIQQIENGGDLYVKGIWPLVDWARKGKTGTSTLVVAVVPRLNMNIQGFGGQSTLTEAFEYNWNGSLEGNYSYPLYPDVKNVPINFFIDGKTGYQGVQGVFARTLGLGSKLNFTLSNVSFGVDFGGMRVGFQRFWGPTAAYAATEIKKFNSWHLVLQFSPRAKNPNALSPTT